MKKSRGKALALVLSLALLVASFPVTFASASTKTLTGIVNKQLNDDIYLVNGGKNRTIDLNDALVDPATTLQTSTRDDVDSAKVAAISHVSGSSLVSLSITGDDDENAALKLKSSTADGTEVISVLYSGDYSDEDGNEYTVKARKNVTVHVYDKDSIVLGEAGFAYDGTTTASAVDFPDDFKTFAKTRNYEKGIGIYVAEPDDGATADVSSAAASLQPAYLTSKTSGTVGSLPASGVVYSISVTSGSDDVHLQGLSDTPAQIDASTTGGALQAVVGKTLRTSGSAWDASTNPYTKDASTTNVAITLKKVDSSGSISSDSNDKYVLKTKVEDKIDVATAWTNVNSTGTLPTVFTVDKEDGKTRIAEIKADTTSTAKNIDVTGSTLLFPDTTTKVTVDENTNLKGIEGTVGTASSEGLVIGDGRVSYVDIDNGNVELSDGKVGNITTAEGDAPTAGDVTINSGSTGNIDTHKLAAASVTIYGGTVGDVYSKTSIDVDANDEDTNVTTGQLKAPAGTIYSDEATVTIGSILAQADDGTIYLKGSDVTVKAINLDSRNTNLILGDDDDAFTGSIPAPTNATNATLETSNSDTTAKVSGDLKIDTINLDSDTTATFDGNITADTIEGDGTLVIKAGNLYVSGSVSSTRLKLSDSTLAAGTTVLKADSDAVDTDDFDTYGFTLTKSAGTNVDTFKIDTLSFAGLQINKTSSTIAKGYSETFTASAYPGGTSLPTGYTIGWELDGGSSDVFTLTTADNTATITVNTIDPNFASENKTTLVATLYDEDGYEVDTSDYGNATCDITAVSVPAIVSDTTQDFSLAQGASYTFKITSATAPNFGPGTGNVVTVSNVGKSGNDYFIKITAVGAPGAATGIYVNGTKLLVVTIKASFTSDTTKDITVKKGATYTYKITAPAAPAFGIGTGGVFTYKLTAHTGNDYFYQITATGAVGAKAGIYVNGAKVNVATVG